MVREAFKDLLKGWGRQHDLMFIPEYELDSATKDTRFVDGALLHELRVPFGYWEAKDEKDDLDAEIAFKFKRGYPQDNIIFEDSTQAVLIQHREEVMRCAVDDVRRWRSCSSSSSATSAPRSPTSARRSSSSRPTCRPCWKRCAR